MHALRVSCLRHMLNFCERRDLRCKILLALQARAVKTSFGTVNVFVLYATQVPRDRIPTDSGFETGLSR